MAINDIWRVSMVGDFSAGNQAIVTMHFREKSGIASKATLTAALVGRWTGGVITVQGNSFNWRQANWYPENVVPPTTTEITTGFPLTGLVAGDCVGQQLAAIVTFRTPYAGRSYRGRVYMPGISESNALMAGPGAGPQADLYTVFNGMVGIYGQGGSDPDWTWGVYSKKLNVFTPISSVVVRTVWGVIRRRRAGVGS